MNSQKLENQLNLALDTPSSIREKTDNLNVGFISETDTWELIVRYEGNIDRIKELSVEITPLINNYVKPTRFGAKEKGGKK